MAGVGSAWGRACSLCHHHMCFLSHPVAQRWPCVFMHVTVTIANSKARTILSQQPLEVWSWGSPLHLLLLDKGNGLCPLIAHCELSEADSMAPLLFGIFVLCR